jgi:hypothetical protein
VGGEGRGRRRHEKVRIYVYVSESSEMSNRILFTSFLCFFVSVGFYNFLFVAALNHVLAHFFRRVIVTRARFYISGH